VRYGPEILRQSDLLGAISQDEGRLTRTYLTPEHRRAGEHIRAWMRDAGMEADFDALGNVVGRYRAADPGAPIVITGSHMDSVVDAGKYDGVFGILTAIAAVKDLNARGTRLPYTFEVVAFGDEEGVRFGFSMIGSKALAGTFDPALLDRKDAQGVTLRDALVAFGGDPSAIASLKRDPRRVAAFIESHIEQGPVLLNEGLAVGVVTAIAGATRHLVRVTGLAGHAGTVPMGARQDALAAAAEMVLFVERHCETRPGLVGTVGKLGVLPGAVNVIPQDVEFTIDVRSADDAVRRAAVAAIVTGCKDIARRRRVAVTSMPFFAADAAPCDATLQRQLAGAIAAHGIVVRHLPSGAGHDAMMFPAVAPTAMLFVRCGNNGISHHPGETMTAEDAEVATAVLLHFFEHYEPPAS